MNKKTKVLFKVLMIALAMVTITTNVFAASSPGKVNIIDGNSTQIDNAGGQVLGIIRVVGIIISVGVLMVVGIKYMMGSAQEKAEYKKVMIPYIVGAGLLFAASVFAEGVYQFFANMK